MDQWKLLEEEKNLTLDNLPKWEKSNYNNNNISNNNNNNFDNFNEPSVHLKFYCILFLDFENI